MKKQIQQILCSLLAVLLFSIAPQLANAQKKCNPNGKCPPGYHCYFGYCVYGCPRCPPFIVEGKGEPVSYRNDAVVKIFDMTGRLVKTYKPGIENENKTGIPAGVYIMRIKNGDNTEIRKYLVAG